MRILILSLFLVSPLAHAETLTSEPDEGQQEEFLDEGAGSQRACVNSCIKSSAECSEAVDSRGRSRIPSKREVRQCCEAVCAANGK